MSEGRRKGTAIHVPIDHPNLDASRHMIAKILIYTEVSLTAPHNPLPVHKPRGECLIISVNHQEPHLHVIRQHELVRRRFG